MTITVINSESNISETFVQLNNQFNIRYGNNTSGNNWNRKSRRARISCQINWPRVCTGSVSSRYSNFQIRCNKCQPAVNAGATQAAAIAQFGGPAAKIPIINFGVLGNNQIGDFASRALFGGG